MFKFKVDDSKFKISLNTCTECNGFGQTTETASVVIDKKTISLGSGCPKCKGTGRRR